MPPLMRAAVMRDRRLLVADVPVPEPGPGEVLVRTLACGICGSDLHALRHTDRFVETSRRAGSAFVIITGTVGIDGVAGAFAELASPDHHAKIMVHP